MINQEGDVKKRLIDTTRLTLRAFSPADAQDLYEYLSEPTVYRFEPGAVIDLNQAQKMAVELCASPYFWAVELKSERKVIGQLYFQQSEPLHLQTWELGYILSPAYQRQGYASEAAGELLNYAFSSLEIHRVGGTLQSPKPGFVEAVRKAWIPARRLAEAEYFLSVG